MYSFYWDLCWDWGLFDREHRAYPFRDNAMYPRSWCVMVRHCYLLRWGLLFFYRAMQQFRIFSPPILTLLFKDSVFACAAASTANADHDVFHTPSVTARYVGAMGIDLALRWAWSIQLSSLVHLSSHEMTLLFEVLEIIRYCRYCHARWCPSRRTRRPEMTASSSCSTCNVAWLS
jgi:hypothetical protein